MVLKVNCSFVSLAATSKQLLLKAARAVHSIGKIRPHFFLELLVSSCKDSLSTARLYSKKDKLIKQVSM